MSRAIHQKRERYQFSAVKIRRSDQKNKKVDSVAEGNKGDGRQSALSLPPTTNHLPIYLLSLSLSSLQHCTYSLPLPSFIYTLSFALVRVGASGSAHAASFARASPNPARCLPFSSLPFPLLFPQTTHLCRLCAALDNWVLARSQEGW